MSIGTFISSLPDETCVGGSFALHAYKTQYGEIPIWKPKDIDVLTTAKDVPKLNQVLQSFGAKNLDGKNYFNVAGHAVDVSVFENEDAINKSGDYPACVKMKKDKFYMTEMCSKMLEYNLTASSDKVRMEMYAKRGFIPLCMSLETFKKVASGEKNNS